MSRTTKNGITFETFAIEGAKIKICLSGLAKTPLGFSQFIGGDALRELFDPLGLAEMKTGDEAFDGILYVVADPLFGHGALTKKTRTRIVEYAQIGHIDFNTRVLTFRPSFSFVDPSEYDTGLSNLYRALCVTPAESFAHLLDGPLHERDWHVRLSQLECLTRLAPERAETRALLGVLLDAPEVRVRTFAARYLRVPETLISIAEEAKLEPQIRVDAAIACAELSERSPLAERTEKVLLEFLAHYDSEIRESVALALRFVGGQASLPALVAASKGLLSNPAKKAAKATLQILRDKLHSDGKQGGLSLDGNAEGALSVADKTPGRS